MSEKNTLIGFDGLIEFGEYLDRLRDTDYTFEIEDTSGEMRECLLDDVIDQFHSFRRSDTERFRVRISYIDNQTGTMGYTDKEFKRRKQ
jgi:hypothetical protein